MESEASVYDVSKKLTVLDAILFVKTAIKDIKGETVSNGFKKCGFLIAQGEEIIVEVDIDHEVLDLLNLTSAVHFLAEDHLNIDENLETESSSTDLK